MIEKEIPDEEERFCIGCSTEDESLKERETLQKPVAIKIRWGSRGCFGSHRDAKWKWKCLECGEVQY
jgi:hypothetical protein